MSSAKPTARRKVFCPGREHDRNALPVARNVHRTVHPVPLPGELWPLVAEHRMDDLQCLVELLESFGERVEVETQLVMLKLKPSRAEPEHCRGARD